MGKKSGPTPPDPVSVANAQGKLNTKAAIDSQKLNMVDQVTPYGSLTYTQNPWDEQGFSSAWDQYQQDLAAYNKQITDAGFSGQGMTGGAFGGGINASPVTTDYWKGNKLGRAATEKQFGKAPDNPTKEQFGYDPLRYTATQTLSPENQQMLDLTNQAGIKFGETANTQLDAVSDRLSQPLPEVDEQYRQDRFDAMVDRFNPVWEQDRQRLETNLANQGIGMGSEAWKRGMDDYNRNITDARLAMDQQAGNEMARYYGLQAESRNQPLNELAAMLSGSQVRAPSFVNTPQANISPADLAGATYSSFGAEQQRQAQKNQFNQALMGGLFGLGSAGIGYAGLSGLSGSASPLAAFGPGF